MCSFNETRAIIVGLALFGAVSLSMLAGCPQTPAVAPVDASDGGCAAACAQLSRLGCAEGAQSDCAASLSHVELSREIRTPSGAALTCVALANAGTVAAIQALGVECGQP